MDCKQFRKQHLAYLDNTLSGEATAFLAPWLIARATQATGNQSLGVFPLIVMFLLALVLLSWVQSKGEAQQ